MRILLVNDHYYPLGGKEQYLGALRRALQEEGHVTGLIHTEMATDVLAADEDEIRFQIPGLQSFRDTRKTITCLRQCIDLFKPDVLHIHHTPVNLFAVAWMLRRIPVLRSVHDADFLCPIRYYVRRRDNLPCDVAFGKACFSAGCLSRWRPSSWKSLLVKELNRRLYMSGARMGTQSHFIETGLRRLKFSSEEVRVLPCFVQPPPAIMCPEEPLFLYVGRLHRMKGPQLAIQAMQAVRPPARLEMIGTGQMRPELETLVDRLGLGERVTFAGHVERLSLEAHYAAARAVVVPSLMPENCSLVIQEALRRGKPVIATASGGNPEMVVDGVNGYLVPHNDVEALTRAMSLFLENPDLAHQLGAKGRELLSKETYQQRAHIEQLMKEYELAIERFQRRPRTTSS